MTYDDALALAAELDDPDDYLDAVNDLLQMCWSDGTPLVDREHPRPIPDGRATGCERW